MLFQLLWQALFELLQDFGNSNQTFLALFESVRESIQKVIVHEDLVDEFLDLLKMEYDYVIVDSPPVQPVSDTLILTQASDYNLFVIRSEETRTASFMSSIKKIQNVGAKINGIIINDLDTSKDSYYSYYYSYSPEYYTKS